MATKPAGGSSPFAPPPEPEPSADGKLTKYEELKQRQDEMAKMMIQRTMLEVNNAAKGRRPEGIHHVLGKDETQALDLDAAVKRVVDNDGVGANYDADKDEWGGPKGQEPTRFGDWEVKGRASDF